MALVGDDGPHELDVSTPDENGIITIICRTCDWNSEATDPMFVESIAMRHGVLTGQIKLR